MGVIACWGSDLHAPHCSGGEGHPHRDCYCGVFENDDSPLSPCPECAPSTRSSAKTGGDER